ncbi:hypothetical protein A4X13_0g7437 [Tilletia indica]|uniref:HAT C-terminal dimerisation domain-containing protein n=1 Tax=Tilletia indica TaxID=43049 RepID=A0A8T8SJK1_9BASI|nr:hypothetical protein A4X13_0g7437 [Tilletia indica]
MTEAVGPEAEAQALKLVAQYHFSKINREEFDAALKLVPMDRQVLREYNTVRIAIMESEPGGDDPLEQMPPIRHQSNQVVLDAITGSQTWDEYIDFMETQEVEATQQQDRRDEKVTDDPPRNKDKVDRPKRNEDKGDRPKGNGLFIPGKENDLHPLGRRVSRSPTRYRDFELDDGAGPSTSKRKPSRPTPERSSSPSRSGKDDSSSDSEASSDTGSEHSTRRPRKRGRSSNKDTKGKGRKVSPKRKHGEKDKGKGKEKSRSKSQTKSKKTRDKPASKLTAQETIEFQAAATKRTTASQRGVKRTAAAAGLDGGGGDGGDGGDDGDDTSSGSDSSSDEGKRQRPPKLSKPAQRSLDGLPLSDGYYGFTFKKMKKTNGAWREKWKCLYCRRDYSITKSKNNNLSSHRKICAYNLKPKTSGVQPYHPPQPDQPLAKAKATADVAVSDVAGSSYRGPAVMGWLSGQIPVSVPLIRRMGLIEIVMNALPFTNMASPAHLAKIRCIDPKAELACVSRTTVRSDLQKFNDLQKEEIKRLLHEHDSLVTLQHDAWTMRGFRYAFLAIVASFVDRDWKYREVLLSFKVLDKRHSGATFAGHLVDTIKDFRLEDKWSGIVVSDSASTNRKMAEILQRQFEDRAPEVIAIAECLMVETEDAAEGSTQESQNPSPTIYQAAPTHTPTPSSFPSASQRLGFRWRADDWAVLCFAHHLNIAIRDGFAAMGIKFAAQLKVIPVPTLVEPSGIDGEVDEGDIGNPAGALDVVDSDVLEDEEEEGEILGAVVSAVPGHAPPADEVGEDDDDPELVFATADGDNLDPSALGEEEDLDGNAVEEEATGAEEGADAIGAAPGTGGAWSAVKRVEGFVKAMHRSAERQRSFREVMEKEYYRHPEKANGAFPSKPNDTRWNSQLQTLRAIAQEKDPKHVYKQFAMSDDDWNNVEQLISILELAERISMAIQTSGSTLTDVLEYHVLMCADLDTALRKLGDSRGARMDAQDETTRVAADATKAPNQIAAAVRAIKLKLGKYRELAAGNRATVLATLLHPNHRLKIFKHDYKTIRLGLRQQQWSENPGPDERFSPLKAARQQRDARVEQEDDEVECADPAEEEIGRYIRNAAAWRTTDGHPGKWWKDNEVEFPRLAKLARIILSVPGSTAAVERIFSRAGIMCSSRRGRLTGETLDLLVTSYAWMDQGVDRLVGLDQTAKSIGAPILAQLDKDIATMRVRSKRRIPSKA